MNSEPQQPSQPPAANAGQDPTEAQREAYASEAARIITWWRCAGCLGVVAMIALGLGLGFWLTLRSDIFQNEAAVTAESCSSPIPDASSLAAARQAAASGHFEADASVLTALANEWLAHSGLVGPESHCCIEFVEAGVVELRVSVHVPDGLDFPGSTLAGAYLNTTIAFAATFDRGDLALLDPRHYRVGERPQAPLHSVADAVALGELLQRFIAWHPELDRQLRRIERVTVHADRCEVWVAPE